MSTDKAPKTIAASSRLDRGVGRLEPERDGVDALLRLCDEHDAVYGHGILLTTTIRKRLLDQWRAMLYAPRDGTNVELLIEHRTWWTAHKCSPDEARMWRSTCEGQWIDHNGGGWTWYGHAGTFTHWKPMPAPPKDGK